MKNIFSDVKLRIFLSYASDSSVAITIADMIESYVNRSLYKFQVFLKDQVFLRPILSRMTEIALNLRSSSGRPNRENRLICRLPMNDVYIMSRDLLLHDKRQDIRNQSVECEFYLLNFCLKFRARGRH